jgi:hypothetical protein
MKVIASAVFMSAALLASVGSASATSYLQASSTEEQLASDAKPKVVTMNSTDASKNIKQEKGVIRFNETGAFFIWRPRKSAARAKDRSGYGCASMAGHRQLQHRAVHQRPDLHGRPGLPGVAEVKRGDRIEVVFSGADPGIRLVVKKPASEPCRA